MSVRRSASRVRGQIIPLAAISAVVLFAGAALALDGGLGYSDRRDDQAISDAAALAGAQPLNMPLPSQTAYTTARQRAVEYVMRGLGVWPGSVPPQCNTLQNIDPSSPATSCPVKAGYDLWVTTPLAAPVDGYDPNHLVQVQLRHNLTGNFLAAGGLSNAFSPAAVAVAVNPIPVPPPVHVVWATERPNSSNGGGNTLLIYGNTTNATAQVDDGQNGAPADCGSTSAPDVFSNEKIHAEGGQQNGALNVNGNVNLSKFDHDQNTTANLLTWWGTNAPGVGVPVNLDPHYAAPTDDTSKYALNPPPVVNGSVVTIRPGRYTKPLTIGTSGSLGGTGQSASWSGATTIVFQNGIYWFDSGNGNGQSNIGSLTFSPGAYAAYSQDYSPAANGGHGGFSARTPGSDRATDGVEFYFTRGATLLAQGGTDNFQAPATIATLFRRPITSTTPLVSIYVDQNDFGDTNAQNGNTRPPGTPGFVNTPVALATLSGFPSGQYYHEQGVIYVQNNKPGNAGTGILATPGSQDLFHYGVQGQLVAPYVVLNIGTVSTSPSLPVAPCSINDTTTNPGNAGKLVQFDTNYIPTSTPGADVVLLQ